MSRPHTTTRASIGASVAFPITALCVTLLAIDNLLGFAGYHVLSANLVLVVVVISVAAGVSAAVCAALARDAPRLIMAIAVSSFVATLSPATGGHSWGPFAIALQAFVPLAFAATAVIVLRSPRGTAAERLIAVLLLILALTWAFVAFIPVALVTFLVAQAGALLLTSTLSLLPVLRRGMAVMRELWSSADIR